MKRSGKKKRGRAMINRQLRWTRTISGRSPKSAGFLPMIGAISGHENRFLIREKYRQPGGSAALTTIIPILQQGLDYRDLI